MLSYSFYETNITLLSKPDQDITHTQIIGQQLST